MDNIQAILRTHYGKDIIKIVPQQGGWAALAYCVYTQKSSYFLKVYEKSRASTPKWTALIDEYVPIMEWLGRNSRLRGKIPVSLLTKTGNYKCEDEYGIYLLYEYIGGETIGEKTLNKRQVSQLSDIISELHTFGEEMPVGTDAIREDFDMPFLQQLKSILRQGYDRLPNDIRKVTDYHVERMYERMDDVEELALSLKVSPVRMALCHTDIHNWNMMQSGNQLMLIDWEGLKLAPVEADLMFLADMPYYTEFLSIYRKSHPNFELNHDALRFYQIRRKLEDIWEFMEQLLFDNQDAQERSKTLNSLTGELKSLNE